MSETEGFGARLRRLREAKGLGNNELDRRVGKKSGYSSRLESGDRQQPTLENARKLAAALEVPVSALTGSAQDDDAPPRLRATRDDDATALGRWRAYAARYPGFRATATFRHREENVPDHVLDAAADDLGLQKSETGPTEAESDAAIDRWLAKRRPQRDGREATMADFGRPATPPPSAQRGKARRGS